jgi:hypothetical protein
LAGVGSERRRGVLRLAPCQQLAGRWEIAVLALADWGLFGVLFWAGSAAVGRVLFGGVQGEGWGCRACVYACFQLARFGGLGGVKADKISTLAWLADVW